MATLPKLSKESDALYTQLLSTAQASDEGLKKLFFQSQVSELAAAYAKDTSDLLRLIQELQTHGLLRTSRWQGALCWSTRPRSAAGNIRLLTTVERTLYEYVEDAHTKGIWLKDLKKRSQIEEQKVGKAMSKLEGARLVKVIKNIRAPAQKTYMLFHLVPSDDVTGGSFFDGGDLDESLIEEVGNLIVFHVRMGSWAEQKVKGRRRERSPVVIEEGEEDRVVDGESPQKKRKRDAAGDIEDAAPRKHRSRRHDSEPDTVLQLAYPAYSRTYPDAQTIHKFITETDAIRQSKAQQLTIPEIQGVIDVLVWDEKLEKVSEGYRTVRGVSFRPPIQQLEEDEEDEDGSGERVGNGLTQAPCGRCPVFELCGEGGPISAGSCDYFGEWLSTG